MKNLTTLLAALAFGLAAVPAHGAGQYLQPDPDMCRTYHYAEPALQIRKAGYECAGATSRAPLDENFLLDESGQLANPLASVVAYYCDGATSGQWFKLESIDPFQMRVTVEPIDSPADQLCSQSSF